MPVAFSDPSSPEGDIDAILGKQAACNNHRHTMGALKLCSHKIQGQPSPKGGCLEIRAFGCAMESDGLHAGFPRRALLAAPKGDWPTSELPPSGAAQTSPLKGVFCHILHKEYRLAVGTHYGQTRRHQA
jgi:hypothetical protein